MLAATGLTENDGLFFSFYFFYFAMFYLILKVKHKGCMLAPLDILVPHISIT